MLGISFDSVEANRAFAEKFGFPYRLLSDTDHQVGLAYGAAVADSTTAKRIAYLIDPQGVIVRTWAKVDVKTHAAEVLAAV